MIGSFQAAVVCDVFSQRLFAVDVLSVDGVLRVLIDHTLGAVLKRVHRGVLPPRPKVSILVILSACGTELKRYIMKY